MEALIGAISGLGTAITGLGIVLWRLQSANRQNGHHQSEELQLLRNIDEHLKRAMEEQRRIHESWQQALSIISADLAFLKGRAERG